MTIMWKILKENETEKMIDFIYDLFSKFSVGGVITK